MKAVDEVDDDGTSIFMRGANRNAKLPPVHVPFN
jgi:hypothetical protein